jgi:hypothetical protein
MMRQGTKIDKPKSGNPKRAAKSQIRRVMALSAKPKASCRSTSSDFKHSKPKRSEQVKEAETLDCKKELDEESEAEYL